MQISENDRYVLNAIFNPNYPLDFNQEASSDRNESKSEMIKKMEKDAVELAEQGKFDEAVVLLTRAIEIDSQQASLYNNRAQAFQLQHQTEKAMADLNVAIDLASNVESLQKTLSLALTQRAILQRLLGKEEEAIDDFKKAAELGSNFAKQQVLLLNPFAAACNQMLSRMMKQTSCI